MTSTFVLGGVMTAGGFALITDPSTGWHGWVNLGVAVSIALFWTRYQAAKIAKDAESQASQVKSLMEQQAIDRKAQDERIGVLMHALTSQFTGVVERLRVVEDSRVAFGRETSTALTRNTDVQLEVVRTQVQQMERVDELIRVTSKLVAKLGKQHPIPARAGKKRQHLAAARREGVE